jgi:galactose mutarotase-like enzyme
VEKLTAATIRSETLTVEISTLGAELLQITDNDDRQLLWNGDPAVWSGRAPILFPVIGVLAADRYRLDGVFYQMPKHGFARHSIFKVVAKEVDAVTMRLTASEETLRIYPFEFQLDIGFAIVANTVRIRATISNHGTKPMPASFGFHPAFRWPLPYGIRRDDHRIRFAEDEPEPVRRIDSRGLLKPFAEATPVRGKVLVIQDRLFVHDALIFDRLLSTHLDYGGVSGPQIRLRFHDFPILGVWTKPGAGFLAIEPWHGTSDPEGFDGDISEKPGMMEIAPDSAKELLMSISLVHQS